MLTRRAFLRSTALTGVVAAGLQTRHLGAAKYDLLIVGGRVIDPANRVDRVMDVGISGGRIAALQGKLSPADAAETINAAGKLVVPGLVDIHTHARTKEMPSVCLSNGVTSFLDAGSQGADRIDEVVEVV